MQADEFDKAWTATSKHHKSMSRWFKVYVASVCVFYFAVIAAIIFLIAWCLR